MLSRSVLLFIMLAIVTSHAQSPSPGTPQKSCREHPRLVGSCFKLHGRLSVYNGAPTLRIWKIGTKRVFGVSEQRFAEPGYSNIPTSVREKVTEENEVTGDYLVCPFTKPRAGEMQMICVESGENMVSRKRK